MEYKVYLFNANDYPICCVGNIDAEISSWDALFETVYSDLKKNRQNFVIIPKKVFQRYRVLYLTISDNENQFIEADLEDDFHLEEQFVFLPYNFVGYTFKSKVSRIDKDKECIVEKKKHPKEQNRLDIAESHVVMSHSNLSIGFCQLFGFDDVPAYLNFYDEKIDINTIIELWNDRYQHLSIEYNLPFHAFSGIDSFWDLYSLHILACLSGSHVVFKQEKIEFVVGHNIPLSNIIVSIKKKMDRDFVFSYKRISSHSPNQEKSKNNLGFEPNRMYYPKYSLVLKNPPRYNLNGFLPLFKFYCTYRISERILINNKGFLPIEGEFYEYNGNSGDIATKCKIPKVKNDFCHIVNEDGFLISRDEIELLQRRFSSQYNQMINVHGLSVLNIVKIVYDTYLKMRSSIQSKSYNPTRLLKFQNDLDISHKYATFKEIRDFIMSSKNQINNEIMFLFSFNDFPTGYKPEYSIRMENCQYPLEEEKKYRFKNIDTSKIGFSNSLAIAIEDYYTLSGNAFIRPLRVFGLPSQIVTQTFIDEYNRPFLFTKLLASYKIKISIVSYVIFHHHDNDFANLCFRNINEKHKTQFDENSNYGVYFALEKPRNIDNQTISNLICVFYPSIASRSLLALFASSFFTPNSFFFAPENTMTDEIIDRYTILNNNIKRIKLELDQKLKHDPIRINGNDFPLLTNHIIDKESIPEFKAFYITLCEYEKILPPEFILKICSSIQ